MRRLALFVLPLCLLLLLLLPVAAQAAPKPTFDQAIDQLYAQGYPQAIDNHLFTMPGTNPQLGFSWAGTWADNAKAAYLADQMRAIGLQNVHLEPVPGRRLRLQVGQRHGRRQDDGRLELRRHPADAVQGPDRPGGLGPRRHGSGLRQAGGRRCRA